MAWTTTPPTEVGKYWFEDDDGERLLVVLNTYHGVLYVDKVVTARRLFRATIDFSDKPQHLVGRWWSEPLQEPPWGEG